MTAYPQNQIRLATGRVRSSETFLFPVSFFPTLFSSTFNSLSIYFLVARGPPLGPKFRKIHSRGNRLGGLGASWPHLGPIFRIFEPPERYQKIVFCLHHSKTPKIENIIDNLAPKRQFWTQPHDVWKPLLHPFSIFFFRKL